MGRALHLLPKLELCEIHSIRPPCLYGETLARDPGAPSSSSSPEPTLPRVYMEKNVSRVMMSCPSQRTEISVCACSAWRDLARLGELTRLKRLHEKKLARPRGSPSLANRVTLPPGSLYPRARFAVSHVNGRRLFLSNCRGGCQLFSIQTGFSRLFVLCHWAI